MKPARAKKGEVLNEEGERDSYPQVIVILRGKGAFQLEERAR